MDEKGVQQIMTESQPQKESDGLDAATVLVVDDEDDTRDIFEIYLEDHGYQVRTAATGESALAQLDGDVDIVLLDRRMPDMAGTDVLDAIRTGPHDCRVAMVTAVAPQEELLSLPVDDYLTKPLNGEVLVDVVAQLLTLDSYEETLSEYHRLVRIHERLQSNTRDRPSMHLLDALADERSAVEQRLEELRAQLPDELVAETAIPDNHVSVC